MESLSTNKISVTIDGRKADMAPGTTILNAARQMGIAIPTLCNYRGIEPLGACRVCIVEIETPRGPKQVASCSYPVENNMQVHTDTPEIRDNRQTISGAASRPGAGIRKNSPISPQNTASRRRRLKKRPNARKLVHLMRALRADLQRPDGPRRDRHVRPRGRT